MLTIITPLKNRTRVDSSAGELRLFPNCVAEAIKHLNELSIQFEWIVSDFHSSDCTHDWMTVYTPDFQWITLDGYFNRGRGLNEGIRYAKYDNLCFLDADMLGGPNFWTDGLFGLNQGTAYFPICWAYKEPEHKTGFWHNSAHGNCFVTKQMHKLVGGVPEYKKWGREDNDFYSKVRKFFRVRRDNCNDLRHQWHPDSFEWKNQYYEQK